jgi:hypothetical protein
MSDVTGDLAFDLPDLTLSMEWFNRCQLAFELELELELAGKATMNRLAFALPPPGLQMTKNICADLAFAMPKGALGIGTGASLRFSMPQLLTFLHATTGVVGNLSFAMPKGGMQAAGLTGVLASLGFSMPGIDLEMARNEDVRAALIFALPEIKLFLSPEAYNRFLGYVLRYLE